MKKKIRLVKLKSKKVALVHRGEGESLRGYALSSAKTEGRTHFSGLRVTFLGTSSAKYVSLPHIFHQLTPADLLEQEMYPP